MNAAATVLPSITLLCACSNQVATVRAPARSGGTIRLAGCITTRPRSYAFASAGPYWLGPSRQSAECAFSIYLCQALGNQALLFLHVLHPAALQAARLTMVQILINSKGLNMNPIQSLYYVSPACLICLSVPFRKCKQCAITHLHEGCVGDLHLIRGDKSSLLASIGTDVNTHVHVFALQTASAACL